MKREAVMYKTVGRIDMSVYDLPSHTETLIGTQLRFNHSDCDAGTDTKERLYVKAVDTGWIAYCHHCGKSGFLRTSPYRVSSAGSYEYPSEEMRTHKEVPAHYKSELYVKPDEFPVEQLLWLYSYGFNDDDIVFFNIKVSKVDGSIVIPKNFYLAEAYYVRRKFTDHFDRGPKALMYRNRDVQFVWRHMNLDPATFASNKYVITEDPISAMKLNLAGANTISLMGTNLTDDIKKYLLNMDAQRIMLYLDPDEAGMKAALKIRKQLQSIVPSVMIHYNPFVDGQPKDMELPCLTKIVRDFYDS